MNLVHRLLKNTVPIREYLLASAPALERWPESFRADCNRAPQRYDLGEVDASYLDLHSLRDAVWTEPRPNVDPDRANLRSTARFSASPERVWQVMTDPKLRQVWMGVPRMDFVAGARGSLVGAEYHCVHGENQKSVFKVLACDVPSEITMQLDFPFVGSIWRTDRVAPEGPAATRVDTAIAWESRGLRAPLVDFMVARLLRKYGDQYNRRVAEILSA